MSFPFFYTGNLMKEAWHSPFSPIKKIYIFIHLFICCIFFFLRPKTQQKKMDDVICMYHVICSLSYELSGREMRRAFRGVYVFSMPIDTNCVRLSQASPI